MSGSDVEAVAARRANLESELAKLDQKRVELLAEDEDLVVTERVLRRLGELHYGEPAEYEEPASSPEGPLQSLLERGLSGGRRALDLIRSTVEKRTT